MKQASYNLAEYVKFRFIFIMVHKEKYRLKKHVERVIFIIDREFFKEGSNFLSTFIFFEKERLMIISGM